MKIVTLSFFIFTSMWVYSQDSIPQNYSDSLTLAHQMIDKLDMRNLMKQRERFIYKSRVESNKINPAILTYIEERIKIISE